MLSNEQIRLACENIDKFLKLEYKNSDSFTKWIKRKTFLESYFNRELKESVFGKHYITCPWSSSLTKTGPDTCECCYVSMYLKAVGDELLKTQI